MTEYLEMQNYFDGLTVEILDRHLPKIEDPVVFHYTSPEGLMGIVGNQCLWFTDAAYLNDLSELSYATNFCNSVAIEYLSERNEEDQEIGARIMHYVHELAAFNRPAVFCTSRKNNLLNQWRDYGKSITPYSIGIDAKSLISNENARFPLVAAQMIYEPSKQRLMLLDLFQSLEERRDEVADELLENNSEEYLLQTVAGEIRRLLYCFKNPAFESEEEIRIMMDIPSLIQNGVHPKFRPSPLGLVPYFEWSLNGHDEKIPLHSVMIGPSNHGALALDAVQTYLKGSGYDNVDCRYSTIPLRNA